VFAAGVPPNVAVPFPLSVKVTPPGSVPVSVKAGVGEPVVITVNVPGVPTVNAVLVPLVITGAVFTVRVKLCAAGVPTPLLAVKLRGYMAAVPDAGVPLNVPVPLPLSTKVTPLGSAPVSVRADTGKPVVITVNEEDVPTVNVVLLALVMTGA